MSTLPQIVNHIEADDALHLGRLLILIDKFGGQKGTHQINGLTKLAKLDFLLRYPAYLERALLARNIRATMTSVHDFERNSIEAKMVRFRYGPWDFRYRRFLNTLAGKGLVAVGNKGRTVVVGVTPQGRLAAGLLTAQPEYEELEQRASLLKRHLDLSGTTLMEFIYKTFPEISSLRLGETIAP
ncbi:MAG: hypothetical protein ACK4SQ_12995 [Allorhizobium sp.]